MAEHQQTHFHKNCHDTDLKTEDILKNCLCSSCWVPRVTSCLKACEISLSREMQYLALGFLHLLKQKCSQKGIRVLQSKTNKQGWCYRCLRSRFLFLCVQDTAQLGSDRWSCANTTLCTCLSRPVRGGAGPAVGKRRCCRSRRSFAAFRALSLGGGTFLRSDQLCSCSTAFSCGGDPWPGWGFGVAQQTPCGDHADFVRNTPRLHWQLIQGKRMWSLTDVLFCSEKRQLVVAELLRCARQWQVKVCSAASEVLGRDSNGVLLGIVPTT